MPVIKNSAVLERLRVERAGTRAIDMWIHFLESSAFNSFARASIHFRLMALLREVKRVI